MRISVSDELMEEFTLFFRYFLVRSENIPTSSVTNTVKIETQGTSIVFSDSESQIIANSTDLEKFLESFVATDEITVVSKIELSLMEKMEGIMHGLPSKFTSDWYTYLNFSRKCRLHTVPIIDILITGILKGIVKNGDINLSSHIPGATVGISHDIDYISKRKTALLSQYRQWLNQGKRLSFNYLWLAISNFIPWVDRTNNFDDMMRYSKSQEFHSTYFFLTETFAKMPQQILRRLMKAGHEIGVHGDFDTKDDIALLEMQINKMQDVASGVKVTGIRQHYLEFTPNQTWELQDKVGLLYDATIGFADDIGFRAGVSHPYVTSQGMIEIPMIFMDTYLQKQFHQLEYWQKEIQVIMKRIKRFNGVMTVNWHQSAYYHPLYKLFSSIVEEAKKNEFLLLTHHEICEYITR